MAFDFAREWPFFPDDEKLRIFEPRANVAILIGHTATDVGGATKVDAPLAVLLERLPAKFPTSQVAAITSLMLRPRPVPMLKMRVVLWSTAADCKASTRSGRRCSDPCGGRRLSSWRGVYAHGLLENAPLSIA